MDALLEEMGLAMMSRRGRGGSGGGAAAASSYSSSGKQKAKQPEAMPKKKGMFKQEPPQLGGALLRDFSLPLTMAGKQASLLSLSQHRIPY